MNSFMLSKSLFIIALLLLLNNLVGVFINLRNDDIYKEQFSNKFGIKLSEKEFYNELNKIYSSGQSDSLLATNTSLLVNKSFAHYWRDEGIKKYNLTIPFYENYILYILAQLKPEAYKKHEFLNWKKAIERGMGLCSQQAIIVSEILREKGINSKMIGLSGHVISTGQINNNKWIILDPDYGVNIPFNIQEIENNPEIIGPYYASEGYDLKQVDTLIRIFGKEGNRIVENATVYSGRIGKIEKFSYWAIWILPLILIIPYVIYAIRVKTNKYNKNEHI